MACACGAGQTYSRFPQGGWARCFRIIPASRPDRQRMTPIAVMRKERSLTPGTPVRSESAFVRWEMVEPNGPSSATYSQRRCDRGGSNDVVDHSGDGICRHCLTSLLASAGPPSEPPRHGADHSPIEKRVSRTVLALGSSVMMKPHWHPSGCQWCVGILRRVFGGQARQWHDPSGEAKEYDTAY